jgi:hypothetical protein
MAAKGPHGRFELERVAVGLEPERPALGPDRVVEEAIERDHDGAWAVAFTLRRPRDRGARRRSLVQSEELGRNGLGGELPALVDVLLVLGEPFDRDGPVGCRLGRSVPASAAVVVGAVTTGQRDQREGQGGVRGETHAALVPGTC